MLLIWSTISLLKMSLKWLIYYVLNLFAVLIWLYVQRQFLPIIEVVYMWSTLLQLAPGSRDLSQTKKRITDM